MKITNQINTNDCGISVISSLFNHYYKKDLNKSELLNKTKITDKGISLNELEVIGSKYGLMLESYEANIQEIYKLKNKKIFVTIIKNNDYLHYVICQKISNKTIKIFCSINGEYEITIDHFDKIWTNIFIDVSKTFFDNKLSTNWKQKISLLDYKFLLFSNVVNILLLIVSFFAATFFQNIMNHVIQNQTIANLTTIAIIYAIIFILEAFINFFNANWYFSKNTLIYTKLHKKTINKLLNKNDCFYTKVNWSNIVNFDEHISKISSFYTIKLNKLVVDFLTIIATAIYISTINFNLILIIVFVISLNLLIELFKTKWVKQTSVTTQNKNNNYFNSLLNFLNFNKLNKMHDYRNELIDNLDSNFYKLKQQNISNNRTISIYNFIENIITSMSYLLIVIFTVKLTIENTMNISTIALVISLMQMNIRSSKSVVTILNEYYSLKINKEIVLAIWNTENNINKNGLEFNNVEHIATEKYLIYNDTFLCGKSGSGKTTLLKQIARIKKCNLNEIWINNLDVNFYDSKTIENNIFYLSDSSYYSEQILIKLLMGKYNNEVKEIINYMNLKSINENELSTGQKQALAFICLLNFENKIILLDEVLNNVDIELKHYLLSIIKPLIVKNNFIVIIDHQNLKDYFSNMVVINE